MFAFAGIVFGGTVFFCIRKSEIKTCKKHYTKGDSYAELIS